MLLSNRYFYLSLLIFSTVFILLSTLFIKIIPLAFNHTVYYCREALNTLSISLPDSTPLMFSGSILLILLGGVAVFGFQLLRTKSYLSSILKFKRKSTRKIELIATELNLSGKIDLVENGSISSFCYGIISPRICVSLNLIRSLTKHELTAVLAHEKSHLVNRDPLKILMSQVITSMFFFIPIFKDLQNFFTLTKEIEADKSAINLLGSSKHLENALGKILNPLTPSFISIATFAQITNLEARVLSLKGVKTSANISFHRILLSVIMLIISLAIIKTPVYSIGNENSHTYIMSPYGNQCATAYTEETVTHDLFSSVEDSSTPANYSVNPLAN